MSSADSEAPIRSVLPLLSKAFSLFLSSVSSLYRLSSWAFSTILPLFLLPLPLLGYLLSPVSVFAHVVYDATITTPYKLISKTAEMLYPLYVFCGVAVIMGAVIGVGGRVLTALALDILLYRQADIPPESPPAEKFKEEKKRRVRIVPE